VIIIQTWNKTDAEFLRDFDSTTSKKGMDYFRGDIDDRPYRIRDLLDAKERRDERKPQKATSKKVATVAISGNWIYRPVFASTRIEQF
jgi:hypothetical protein